MNRGRLKAGGSRAAAYVGYGDLAHQIKELFGIQEHKGDVYFDDYLFSRQHPNSFGLSDYLKEKFSCHTYYVSLGYKHLQLKSRIIDDLAAMRRQLPVCIHKSSFIGSSASIGQGSVIYPMCNVGNAVNTGRGVVLNSSVTVAHDSTIGDCCYLSPGVVVCGFVEIGSCCFVGAGSVIANGVKIGDNVVIGLGTVVTGDIPDNSSVIGNPMKKLKNRLRLS